MRLLLLIAVTTLSLPLLASCRSYGGTKYEIDYTSIPNGADLYLIPRREWVKLAPITDVEVMKSYRLPAGDGTAPIQDHLTIDYQYVLIGVFDGVIGEPVHFTPHSHDQRIVARQ